MADAGGGREEAVAEYFRWNTDGFVQAVSVLGSAAILLGFAMIDRLADTGLGYSSHRIHLILVALAVALATPVGFRERHAMLALRMVVSIVGLACLFVPTIGWRLIPPAHGATPHLPTIAIVLAAAAFIPAACVLASTYGEHWRSFLDYCRKPSAWSRRRDGAA